MANPLIPQGTLNRLRTSVLWPAFPALNVTAPYLGKASVHIAFQGNVTEYIPTLTGAVTAPEPYQQLMVTMHLLRTQSLANAYQAQILVNSLLGDGTVRTDAGGFGSYLISNCSIVGVDELNLDGTDPGYAVRIGGGHAPCQLATTDRGQGRRMVRVAMRDDPRFGRRDRQDGVRVRHKIRPPDPDRARETADEKRPHGTYAPQMKIAETGVQRRIRMHRQIPRLQSCIVRQISHSGHRDPGRGLRIGGLRGAAHQNRATRFRPQMPRMLRQIGQQQQNGQIGRARRGRQRGEGLPAVRRRRQRAGPRRAQQLTGLESMFVRHYLFTPCPRYATIGAQPER